MSIRVLIGLLFLSSLCHGAAATFSDWIDSRHPAYGLLKKAAEEADFQGWQRDRLESGRALPQASARILAETLRRDPRVDDETKSALAKALPSEVEAMAKDDFADLSKTAAMLAANDAKLKDIESTLADNNYSPSSPLGLQATFESRFDPVEVEGVAADQSMQTFDHLQGQFQGQTGLGTYIFVLDWQQDTQDQGQDTSFGTEFSPWSFSSVSFLSSPFGFDNVQVNLGMMSMNLSKLIYSAPTYPYMSPFYQAGAIVPASFADTPNGERNSQGLYIRKQGNQGVWLFNDFQFNVAPEAEAYEDFNHSHSWEIDSRGDLPSFGWIPFTDSTLLYMTYTFLGNESNEINTFNNNSGFYESPLAVPEQSQNYALGFESQLSGGGSLIFEGASSNWYKENALLYPQVSNEDLNDQAYYMALSKSLGRMVFALQGSQIGPYFVPGGHTEPAGGDQQYDRTGGLALDSLNPIDPRNNAIDSSWKTISEDQAWISNNSRRASIEATWLDSWGSFGATVASSEEIEPSGPWIEASEFFNNSPYNGFSFFQLFYDNYTDYYPEGSQQTSQPNANYNINQPTTAPAYYQGKPISSVTNPVGLAEWDDLEQFGWRNTTQTIWLSQNGVGDPNLRADSTKYFNTFRADLSLDLGSIFKTTRKAHLQLYSEYRDTAEQLRFALGAQNGLLDQSIYGMDFIWQFLSDWEMVATAGQEIWSSEMSYYPIQFTDNSAGIGFNSLLSHYVAGGLEVNYRLLFMQHEDSNFVQKDFAGWLGTVGVTYVFSNSN